MVVIVMVSAFGPSLKATETVVPDALNTEGPLEDRGSHVQFLAYAVDLTKFSESLFAMSDVYATSGFKDHLFLQTNFALDSLEISSQLPMATYPCPT